MTYTIKVSKSLCLSPLVVIVAVTRRVVHAAHVDDDVALVKHGWRASACDCAAGELGELQQQEAGKGLKRRMCVVQG